MMAAYYRYVERVRRAQPREKLIPRIKAGKVCQKKCHVSYSLKMKELSR